MAVRQRDQNPVVGSTIRLRLFTYSSNLLEDVGTVDQVEIYYLDPSSVSATNTDGRILLSTIAAGDVVQEADGTYYVDLVTSAPTYVVGEYLDVWTVTLSSAQAETKFTNCFTIYRELIYATTLPVVYDFDFRFEPNRMTKGSKKWLRIQILPQVPRATTLEKYYENLAISSALYISIAKKCDPCSPKEEDLRTIVDWEEVDQRQKVFGFYFLDTEDMDCGLYDVWFKLDFGGNVYISEKNQFLVF